MGRSLYRGGVSLSNYNYYNYYKDYNNYKSPEIEELFLKRGLTSSKLGGVVCECPTHKHTT